MSIMDTKVNKSGDTMTGYLKVGGQIWVTGADGSIELIPSNSDALGGLIDFHFAGSSEDFTSRLIERQTGLTYESSIDQRKTGEILTTVSRGSNWIRLGNRIQICWDDINSSTATGSYTFPMPFTSLCVITNIIDSNITEPRVVGISYNTTTLYYKGIRQAKDGAIAIAPHFSMLAIGYWY